MKSFIAIFVVISMLCAGALLRPYVEAGLSWLQRKWEALKRG